MTTPNELPGDPDEFEDADGLTSVGLGVLAELSAIRQELQLLRVELATGAAPTDPAFECECGEAFADEAAARDHAVTQHGAPRQGDHWQRVFDGVEQ